MSKQGDKSLWWHFKQTDNQFKNISSFYITWNYTTTYVLSDDTSAFIIYLFQPMSFSLLSHRIQFNFDINVHSFQILIILQRLTHMLQLQGVFSVLSWLNYHATLQYCCSIEHMLFCFLVISLNIAILYWIIVMLKLSGSMPLWNLPPRKHQCQKSRNINTWAHYNFAGYTLNWTSREYKLEFYLLGFCIPWAFFTEISETIL